MITYRTIVLALALALVTSLPAFAADMTITTTGPHATRLAAAVGARDALKDVQGVPRAATAAEVKTHIIRYLRELVRTYEGEAALQTHEKAFVPIDPT